MNILREHPLMKSGLKGSGKNEEFGFRLLNKRVGLGLKSLVLSSQSSLSRKEAKRLLGACTAS